MAVVDNFIQGIQKKPLVHVGTTQTPRTLVIHYSVTDTVAQAVNVLNQRRLSYHILIEKNGKAFQTRKFTESAAHPGLSNWKAQADVTLGASLGRNSVGICLMNKGFAFGNDQSAPGKLIYNPDDPSMQRWEIFPAAQLASCIAIAKDIIAAYPIAEVVGHHDIAIMGKFDPGPLFDLAGLDALTPQNTKTLGHKTKVSSNDGSLNVRKGPSANTSIVRTLQNGHTVFIRSIAYSGKKADCIDPSSQDRARFLTRWASVDIDGSNKHAGFVNMRGLASTPLAPQLAAKL